MNNHQPAFNINTQSGHVQWGDITCHPQLKIDDFQKDHPTIKLTWRDDGRGLWRSEIQLHRLPINNELWNAKIAYENQYLHRIECTPGGLTRDLPEGRWWHYHLRWMISVKGWLRKNIGEPNFIDPVTLYDDGKIYSQLEHKILETWQYTYDWGNITFNYDSLELRSGLTILYESENQIRDWNDLLNICHWAIQQSQNQGTSTTNLSVIRDTITLLGKHFKFTDLNPKISRTGLIFWSSELTTYIDMDIWRNRDGRNYRLYRRDTATEIQVPSNYDLLHALERILELE